MFQGSVKSLSIIFCLWSGIYASAFRSSTDQDSLHGELVIVGRACVPHPFFYNDALYAELKKLEKEHVDFLHISDYLGTQSVNDLHSIIHDVEQKSFRVEQLKRKVDILYDELSYRYNKKHSNTELQRAYCDIRHLKYFYDQLYLTYRYKDLILPWQSNVDVDVERFKDRLKHFVETIHNPVEQLKQDQRLSASNALRNILQKAIVAIQQTV